MSNNKWQALIVVLLPSAVLVAGANQCYRCRNGRSNAECNSGIKQTCGEWNLKGPLANISSNYACEVEVFRIFNLKIIKKRCIEGSQCYNPNLDVCDVNGRRCTYCCFGDLCNEAETPAEVISTTPRPSPTPGYQTFWITLATRNTSTTTTPFRTSPPDEAVRRGQKGSKGDPGRPGPPGLSGDKGKKGLQGSRGMHGSVGVDKQGPKGDQGQTGLKGAKGDPGDLYIPPVKGDVGLPGARGNSGLKGEKGQCLCPDDEVEAVVAFSVSAKGVRQTKAYYEHIGIETVLTNVTNVGGGVQSNVMDFAAPVDGVYVFHVTSIANGNGATPLVLVRGSDEAMVTTARSARGATGIYPVGYAHCALWLDRGDTVSVVVKEKRPGFFWGLIDLYSPSDVNFSGFLLATVTTRTKMVPL